MAPRRCGPGARRMAQRVLPIGRVEWIDRRDRVGLGLGGPRRRPVGCSIPHVCFLWGISPVEAAGITVTRVLGARTPSRPNAAPESQFDETRPEAWVHHAGRQTDRQPGDDRRDVRGGAWFHRDGSIHRSRGVRRGDSWTPSAAVSLRIHLATRTPRGHGSHQGSSLGVLRPNRTRLAAGLSADADGGLSHGPFIQSVLGPSGPDVRRRRPISRGPAERHLDWLMDALALVWRDYSLSQVYVAPP